MRTALTLLTAFFMAGCVDEDDELEFAAEDDNEVGFRAFCYGSGCNGKDPVEYGCTGLVTKATKSCNGGTLELRYSSSCNAKWAKVTRNDGNTLTTAWVTGGKGSSDTVNWSYMYSNMWNGTNAMKACAVLYPCKGDCGSNPPTCCTIAN